MMRTIPSCPASWRLETNAFVPTEFSWSADHIGQQSEKSRALDRPGKLSLLLGRNGRDPAGHDFAALGYVTLQQPYVLVIDLRGVLAGEGAGLTAAKERAAG